MTARLPALEAVAEALAAVNDALGIDADITVRGDEVKAYVSAEDGGRVKTYFGASECRKLSAAFANLAARLDATPAAQSPTPTPTDKELRELARSAFLARSHQGAPDVTRVSDCEAARNRALYNAGRAACVARLREMAESDAMAETRALMDDDQESAEWHRRACGVLRQAADALESER